MQGYLEATPSLVFFTLQHKRRTPYGSLNVVPLRPCSLWGFAHKACSLKLGAPPPGLAMPLGFTALAYMGLPTSGPPLPSQQLLSKSIAMFLLGLDTPGLLPSWVSVLLAWYPETALQGIGHLWG
jgi:hypothetical protein